MNILAKDDWSVEPEMKTSHISSWLHSDEVKREDTFSLAQR
jgi:hypothetical protein